MKMRARICVCIMPNKLERPHLQYLLAKLSEEHDVEKLSGETIVETPIERWPRCDVLISFYHRGLPFSKVHHYASTFGLFALNDFLLQYAILDRRVTREMLACLCVPTPRGFAVNRGYLGVAEDVLAHIRTRFSAAFVFRQTRESDLVETPAYIELNGTRLYRPFVEKPANAEDHAVFVYFPTFVRRLFRKVGDISSDVLPGNHKIRRVGSFVYEEFCEAAGVDIKVYALGAEYTHAEARKAPTVDGIVERDSRGKERREKVRLSEEECEMARRITLGLCQRVCGLDLLRTSTGPVVIDVNGWSFVKTRRDYYDRCARMISREIVNAKEQSCAYTRRLKKVVRIYRHADRTPKQKIKVKCRGVNLTIDKERLIQKIANVKEDVISKVTMDEAKSSKVENKAKCVQHSNEKIIINEVNEKSEFDELSNVISVKKLNQFKKREDSKKENLVDIKTEKGSIFDNHGEMGNKNDKKVIEYEEIPLNSESAFNNQFDSRKKLKLQDLRIYGNENKSINDRRIIKPKNDYKKSNISYFYLTPVLSSSISFSQNSKNNLNSKDLFQYYSQTYNKITIRNHESFSKHRALSDISVDKIFNYKYSSFLKHSQQKSLKYNLNDTNFYFSNSIFTHAKNNTQIPRSKLFFFPSDLDSTSFSRHSKEIYQKPFSYVNTFHANSLSNSSIYSSKIKSLKDNRNNILSTSLSNSNSFLAPNYSYLTSNQINSTVEKEIVVTENFEAALRCVLALSRPEDVPSCIHDIFEIIEARRTEKDMKLQFKFAVDCTEIILKWGGVLTHSGIWQSKEMGERLRYTLTDHNAHILRSVYIASSTESRVRESARIFAQSLLFTKNVDVIEDKELLGDTFHANYHIKAYRKTLKQAFDSFKTLEDENLFLNTLSNLDFDDYADESSDYISISHALKELCLKFDNKQKDNAVDDFSYYPKLIENKIQSNDVNNMLLQNGSDKNNLNNFNSHKIVQNSNSSMINQITTNHDKFCILSKRDNLFINENIQYKISGHNKRIEALIDYKTIKINSIKNNIYTEKNVLSLDLNVDLSNMNAKKKLNISKNINNSENILDSLDLDENGFNNKIIKSYNIKNSVCSRNNKNLPSINFESSKNHIVSMNYDAKKTTPSSYLPNFSSNSVDSISNGVKYFPHKDCSKPINNNTFKHFQIKNLCLNTTAENNINKSYNNIDIVDSNRSFESGKTYELSTFEGLNGPPHSFIFNRTDFLNKRNILNSIKNISENMNSSVEFKSDNSLKFDTFSTYKSINRKKELQNIKNRYTQIISKIKKDKEMTYNSVSEIYNNFKYDITHNNDIIQQVFQGHDKFYILLKKINSFIIQNEYGMNINEKKIISKAMSDKLFFRLINDINDEVSTMCIYFTKESRIYTILNLFTAITNKQFEIKEFEYGSYISIELFEDASLRVIYNRGANFEENLYGCTDSRHRLPIREDEILFEMNKDEFFSIVYKLYGNL